MKILKKLNSIFWSAEEANVLMYFIVVGLLGALAMAPLGAHALSGATPFDFPKDPASSSISTTVVHFYAKDINSRFCNGVAVHPRIVLTAAHCMDTYSDVLAGLAQGESTERLKYHFSEVESVVYHPTYKDLYPLDKNGKKDLKQFNYKIGIDLVVVLLKTPLKNLNPAILLDPEQYKSQLVRTEKANKFLVISGIHHDEDGQYYFKHRWANARVKKVPTFDYGNFEILEPYGNMQKVRLCVGDSGSAVFLFARDKTGRLLRFASHLISAFPTIAKCGDLAITVPLYNYLDFIRESMEDLLPGSSEDVYAQ
jgi:hypothetical protein